MDDDVKPKIYFDNAQWRYKNQDPEFGWKNPGDDDVNVPVPTTTFMARTSAI
jgi:hypothetical protein